MKTLPTWKIAYTIEDGEYEYGDYMLREAEHLTEADAAALVAAFWCGAGHPAEEEAFARALLEEGYATLPGDGRLITDLCWELVSPITVTIHNGIVEDVTGLPEGATLEVRDLDDDDRDGQGRLVPVISVWEGPR